jgi:hypothetical protein
MTRTYAPAARTPSAFRSNQRFAFLEVDLSLSSTSQIHHFNQVYPQTSLRSPL